MSHIFADHMVLFFSVREGVQFRYLEQGVISLFFEQRVFNQIFYSMLETVLWLQTQTIVPMQISLADFRKHATIARLF